MRRRFAIILRHYDEYFEDSGFRFPIKKRHRTDSVVRRDVGERDRDLLYADFLKVRKNGQKRPTGARSEGTLNHAISAGVASVGSVCTLLGRCAPRPSHSGKFRHQSLAAHRVVAQKGCGERYLACFKDRQGTFFSYRQVQDLYERAFKKAGVEFTGTHSLRHGGCRAICNEAGGDMALAGQILGNEDSNTVRVYARPDRGALKRHVNTHWKNWEAGCTNLHEQGI